MRFTVTFRNPAREGHYDNTLSLNYVPGPCFFRGEEVVLNLAVQGPDYPGGGVQTLVQQKVIDLPEREQDRECVVIVHPEGHGRAQDADVLVAELKDAGFRVRVVSPPWT